MSTDHPLRLAVGSHQAGTGQGCAMNVISWENGDTSITDMPDCADPMLAKIVQRVNDRICTHRDGKLLCPDCSVQLLDLAHRTVGTGGPADLERRRVWVWVAADQARQVLHLATDQKVALAAIEAAEAWADSPCKEKASAARHAANAANAAYTTYTRTAPSAAAAAYAAYDAYDDAYVTYDADDAYAYAATATPHYRLQLAHRAIDLFQQLTGHTEHTPDPTVVTAAINAMTTRGPQ